MMVLFKNFLSLFGNFFKLVEENSQINVIKNLEKDQSGLIKVKVAALSSETVSELYPHYILATNIIRNQFSEFDIQIFKTIVLAEGDIFIIAKEYMADQEVYVLNSCLDKNILRIKADELHTRTDILSRINKRFLRINLDKSLIKINLESDHEKSSN